MDEAAVLAVLAEAEAVMTDSHFIYTGRDAEGNRNHGPAYINMRALAHCASIWDTMGLEIARKISVLATQPDFIIGPETLGRTLGQSTATWLRANAVWCKIADTQEGKKKAVFDEKLDFGRLVAGKRFFIVDELLNTGSSVAPIIELIRELEGEVMGVGVAVSRSPEITAEALGVPLLVVLATVRGFRVLSDKECKQSGPCSRRVPVVLRPGHGHEWIKDHPDYPVAE